VQTLARSTNSVAAPKSGPQGRASVRFPYPEFVTAPEVGQLFADEELGGYKIETVMFVGDGWECEVSPA
jgi:hypothetical protein